MSRHDRRHDQRGMALLTVLLLVAAMSVLIIATLDDIRFGLRRTGNAQALAQARWYALGTEALAATQLRRFEHLDLDSAEATALLGRRQVLPIEQGAIALRIDDATTCFNLNSVVEGMPEAWTRRDLGVRQFVALLQALEFPEAEAEAMADALVDWIDSDQIRAPRGAEDATYLADAQGYRTAATLLAEPSELRAIRGFAPAAYARIRPHVCALPGAELSPVNVNALRAADAPILAMLTLGAVTPRQAAEVIAHRPAAGWRETVEFWAHPALRQASGTLDNAVFEQVLLRSRHIALSTEVEHAGAQVVLGALFETGGNRGTRLVARRWTLDE